MHQGNVRNAHAAIACLGAWLAIVLAPASFAADVKVQVPLPAASPASPQMIISAAPPVAVAVPPANVLPPIIFSGSVAGEEIFNLLRSKPRYSALSKDLVGSPIALRVFQTFELTAGGTASALASAILTGSTLGILPMVTNQDLVITYELVVNGSVLSRYAYTTNLTRVDSIYAGTDTTYGLGSQGLTWAKGTVDRFVADTANDEKLAKLLAEYQFYFGSPPG